MPNWCNNNIDITGPISKIEPLYKQAISEEDYAGLLNTMVPMPEILRNTKSPTPDNIDSVQLQVMIAQTGHTNWYDWCVSNWSTKWEVSPEGLEFVDNNDGTASISGWFDSAWAPPIGAYEKFLEANEDCTIMASYYEPGMDFGGFYDNGDDQYIEELGNEYRLPEDQQSQLFKRLDDEYGLSEQFAEYDEMNEENK